MGFRFSKRISIMPGVRLNFGLGGASLSLGRRGSSVTVGKRGVFGNVGVPGTGLSYRTRLDRPTSRSSEQGMAQEALAPNLPDVVIIKLIDDAIAFFDPNEEPIAPALLPTVRRLAKERTDALLATNVEIRNQVFETLATLHRDIPPSTGSIANEQGKPQEQQFPDRQSYMEALMTWRAEAANAGPGVEALEQAVLQALSALEWPRETNIALELRGDRLMLDVDLPEIEDMPVSRWTANLSQLRLVEKPLSQKDRAATYLAHVSSVLLRLIGYSMAVDRHIGSVALSAYTQRSSSTGRPSNDYVAVVEVSRAQWGEVNCSAMSAIDPENLLRRFGAKMDTNSTGVLKIQQPLH